MTSRFSARIELHKKSGIPLYVQLKHQIVSAIQVGALQVGDRMPTERELAGELGISRKTVSHAYNLLEEDGIILSHQGRGTFVNKISSAALNNTAIMQKNTEILKRLDELTDIAIKADLTQTQLLKLAGDRIRQRYLDRSEPRALFIECNIEQAQRFACQLEEETGIGIDACTLGELKRMSDELRDIIEMSKSVITTFNHMGAVKEIMDDKLIQKTVLGVAITPNLESLIRIAKYPTGAKFGLVSLSEEFFFNVKSAMKSAGLDHIEIQFTNSFDDEVLNDFVQDLDVVIVSPGRMEDMRTLINSTQDIISFEYLLDQGSVGVVTSKLTE